MVEIPIKINAIKITNRTIFPDGTPFDYSEAYCMPMIIPIEETRVKSGDKVKLQIFYKMCSGLINFKSNLTIL